MTVTVRPEKVYHSGSGQNAAPIKHDQIMETVSHGSLDDTQDVYYGTHGRAVFPLHVVDPIPTDHIQQIPARPHPIEQAEIRSGTVTKWGVQQRRLLGLLLDLLDNVAGLNHITVAVELIDGVMHTFVHVGLMLGLAPCLLSAP
jgi:hypothetical protein